MKVAIFEVLCLGGVLVGAVSWIIDVVCGIGIRYDPKVEVLRDWWPSSAENGLDDVH